MFNKFAIVCAVTLVMTTQVWADEKSVMEKPPVILELDSGAVPNWILLEW